MEAAPHYITANTIAPSFIYNEFIPHIYPEDEIERMYENIPYPRKGTPEDVANTVVFLVSDEGEYVTGTDHMRHRRELDEVRDGEIVFLRLKESVAVFRTEVLH